MALAGAVGLALPATIEAKPPHMGHEKASGKRGSKRSCSKPRRVGFVAAGSLVDFDAPRLTLAVRQSNTHARRWLEHHEPVFDTTSVKVVFAGVPEGDGSGTIDSADVLPGDRVRVVGKLSLPKRRCTSESSLVLRRIKVAREIADETAEPAPYADIAKRPKPPPPPPTSTGSVIWAGDAENTLSLEWATGNAFDVNGGNATSTLSTAWSGTSRVRRVSSPVAQGAYAYAMTVLASDRDAYTSSAQRTELGQNNAARTMSDGVNRQMYQGQERWIGWQIRIPSSYPNASWNTLVQLKGAGSGNGPLGIYWENNRVVLKKSASQTYGSTNIATVWSPSVSTPRDSWIKLLIHVKWSAGDDGFYELFGDLADGQGLRELKPLTNGWTLKYASDGSPVSVGARFGIYRSALAADATAYFDGFAVAATRADAALRAFGAVL